MLLLDVARVVMNGKAYSEIYTYIVERYILVSLRNVHRLDILTPVVTRQFKK